MSATMTELQTALPAFAAELWTSLIALLRSHVAMHSIARPGQPLRIAADSHSVTSMGRHGKLILTAPDAGGIGLVEFRPENGELGDEYFTFFFTEGGLIGSSAWDDPIDMEAAVECWLGKVQA